MKKIFKYSMLAFLLSCQQHRPPKVDKRPPIAPIKVTFEGANKIDRQFLLKGQESYEIHCVACHGPRGEGQRKMIKGKSLVVPSLHTQRLKEVSPDFFYEVITLGKGKMAPLGNKIPEDDRWAIAYFVRMLQLTKDLENKNKQ